MPRDDWAKARAKDVVKRLKRPSFWSKPRSKKHKAGKPVQRSWFDAIAECKSNRDLTAVAKSIGVMKAAGKMSDKQYSALVNVGKRKRAALMQTNSL